MIQNVGCQNINAGKTCFWEVRVLGVRKPVNDSFSLQLSANSEHRIELQGHLCSIGFSVADWHVAWSQSRGLSSSSGPDVAVITIEKTIADSDICPGSCISKLSSTDTTREALNMKIQTECFNDHGCTFSEGQPTS